MGALSVSRNIRCLLVKKYNTTWKFFVDYGGLDQTSVPNCFSIPTVDVMLHELSGATIFSKMDLKVFTMRSGWSL